MTPDREALPSLEGFWYLAGPYSADRDRLFLQHEQSLAKLLRSGYKIFSPIVHCHALAKRFAMPTDEAFWRDFNFSFIAKSNGLILLLLPEWRESLGVKDELEEAQRLNLPIRGLEFSENEELTFIWRRSP